MTSSQFLRLKAYIIEMIIAVAAIGLGLFIWWPMNGTNSGVTFPLGAALVVAGFMVFLSAMDSIHTRRR